MDIEYVGRVLARLKPFVRDGVIRRTRVERVLSTLQGPADEVRPSLDRLLARAGITIDEDAPSPGSGTTRPTAASPEASPTADTDALAFDAPRAPVPEDTAMQAARRRMNLDRFITNHAKVVLRPEEEVGLGILIRGENGKPLDQGGFAVLTGESRQAAECLLLHNQGLVHSVAKRYAPAGMTYEDVFQHGVTGLIRAIELYDPHLGYKFSTYAMNWLRQSITRGIANEARLIRLPVHMVERVRKVWAARSRLTIDGQTPSVHELALACGLGDDEVMECLLLGPQDILSLDTPIGPDGESTLADLLDAVDTNCDPVREVEFKMLQEDLHAVLDTLSEREAGVISLRFGLADGAERTLDEIGKVYGVTRERIRQIESKTMTKLRHQSRSEVLRPYLAGAAADPKAEKEDAPEGSADLSGEATT